MMRHFCVCVPLEVCTHSKPYLTFLVIRLQLILYCNTYIDKQQNINSLMPLRLFLITVVSDILFLFLLI